MNFTGSDREKIVEQIRRQQGYTVHRVRKSSHPGQNDIWGAFDIISLSLSGFVGDQVTTVHHISDHKERIELLPLPKSDSVLYFLHGIDIIVNKRMAYISKYILLQLTQSGWKKYSLIDAPQPIDSINSSLLDKIYLNHKTEGLKLNIKPSNKNKIENEVLK